MRYALVWAVRLCGVVGWGATAVACTWLLGAAPMPKPWYEPLVWGGVAAGCAVVRALLLWVLRAPAAVVWWRGPRAGGRVSLSKERTARGRWEDLASDWDDVHELGFPGHECWTKVRTAGVWVLVCFASGAFFASVLSSPDSGGRAERLRDAGGQVGTATIAQEPAGVRADVDDDDVVQGYASRLVVAVPGGPERLAVKGAYTYEKPREGSEVEVLWARSAPELGGYVNENDDLPMIAAGHWKAFPDSDLGDMTKFAFILLAVVFGAVLTPIFSLPADADDLQKLAWSAPAQTVRAGFAAAMYLGWRPILLGDDPRILEMFFAGLGFFLVLAVYIGTSIRSLR